MNNFLYLDIETIPSQSPEYAAKVAETITAPAQYKKPESIAKWLEDNRETAAAEQIAKTSFDGGRGHVCCIGWAYGDDDDVTSASVMDLPNGEVMALEAFFQSLDAYHSTTIVGHYVGGFDIRFLTQRAIVLDVKLPPANIWPRDPKPWSDGIHDTMLMWAGQKGTISMDNLADILGIEGKTRIVECSGCGGSGQSIDDGGDPGLCRHCMGDGVIVDDFSGKDVAQAWANGEHEKIAAYCRADVERTRSIHRRFMEVGW